VYEYYEGSGYGSRSNLDDGGTDPFGGANNAPSHIAGFGLDLGFQSAVTWDYLGWVTTTSDGTNVAQDGKSKKVYEVNAAIKLASLGIQGGETIEMWWAMECGNDYGMMTAIAPEHANPVPEPGTLLLLGLGLFGVAGLHWKRRS
jgi:hypothetical protein